MARRKRRGVGEEESNEVEVVISEGSSVGDGSSIDPETGESDTKVFTSGTMVKYRTDDEGIRTALLTDQLDYDEALIRNKKPGVDDFAPKSGE